MALTWSETQNRLSAMRWRANKRTLPRPQRVPEEVLDRVEDLHRKGDFNGAVDDLKSQPSASLNNDNMALAGLAMSYFGMGDYDNALKTLDQADTAVSYAKARIEVNRSNILKVTGDFDAALKAAYLARQLKPDWAAPHLMVISIRECRGSEGDRSMLAEEVNTMNQLWPEWREDECLREYLQTDIDYADLRSRPEFSKLFVKGDRR